VIELDDRVIGPEAKANLVAQHQLARALHEHGQHGNRLLGQVRAAAIFA
jgi:hypothetical protein